MSLSDLQGKIDALNRCLEQLNSTYRILVSHCNKQLSYQDIISNLYKLSRLQEINATIDLRSETLKNEFKFLFNGLNTDWDTILNALTWTSDFKKFNAKHSLPFSFVQKICGESSASQIVALRHNSLKEQMEGISTEWNWFISLFSDKEELSRINLFTLWARVEKCANSIFSLEEWIDFRACRDECRKEGLSEYIEKIEEMKIISRTLFVDVFLKRFYRLWLDAILPNYPAVHSFRRRVHEDVMSDFYKLDFLQLAIARARIKERLVSRLPDLNMATSAVDEVGILKRELNKQKKIMPLRKLFKEIPNLLTALKPCLMMSPLSVSLFLQSDSYNFDIVIFDEASQVCTEDAIGAIMRGIQVIIAGDSKQLPPTSFFSATTSDGDFDSNDYNEEECDEDAFESILDETLTILPERTLRWHYRSRHEHLIAFSNAKIYNYNLITFPSHMDKVNDNGVEYIYVSNGVYDRGGKKHNINEAKKVAEIVFEHIKKFPNRSLGVVTFSEAQQQAVEMSIRQLRLQSQQYEPFFSEEKEESFFIKNLENVQGDERDTIIFSIGYGKDANGVMYMNFGPLSRNGGYRRLNVAITRAKFNVKLVGSILPTDIRLESTNAEGVKMLRSYIEFAMNGAEILQRELSYTDVISVDSPFEESVYDFLVKNGYSVATQVGCSGYRIDLAVKHPTLSGRFVLGVECDGATYHSARTARERDRLRQTVLEDIGWKIYRIWSTDWIKDPINEGQKLLDAVNDAIADYVDDSLEKCSRQSTDDFVEFSGKPLLDIEVAMDTEENGLVNGNMYGFDCYIETDVNEVDRHPNDVIYLAKVINHVVSIEYPIHFELLCKRIAPLFGNQKATSKVRKAVDFALQAKLLDVVERKNDFCWQKGNPSIRVRIPKVSDPGRPINYICTEELAEAMYIIVSKCYGITIEGLYVATARAFGFNRIGGNISQAMQRACEYLVQSGRAKNIDGKIVIT